jgi:hypothetical protein
MDSISDGLAVMNLGSLGGDSCFALVPNALVAFYQKRLCRLVTLSVDDEGFAKFSATVGGAVVVTS